MSCLLFSKKKAWFCRLCDLFVATAEFLSKFQLCQAHLDISPAVLLTIPDPSHRVTSGTGWEEQKNHRFYKGSWEQVEKCHEMCRSDKT
jgi:hypothetical protein